MPFWMLKSTNKDYLLINTSGVSKGRSFVEKDHSKTTLDHTQIKNKYARIEKRLLAVSLEGYFSKFSMFME